MTDSKQKALEWFDREAPQLADKLIDSGLPAPIVRAMRPLLEAKLRGALEDAEPEQIDEALVGIIVWLAGLLSDLEDGPADALEGLEPIRDDIARHMVRLSLARADQNTEQGGSEPRVELAE